MQSLKVFISTLLILIITSYSVFSETIGNDTKYSSSTTRSNRQAMPFIMSEDGDIQSITMYHDGGSSSNDVIFAVYADNGSDYPGTRLGMTAETPISTSTGWQTINLSSVSVNSGQKIWLAWVYESNPGIYYTTGSTSTGRARSSYSWSGGMPSSYGSSTLGSAIYSIYATYTPGGGPVCGDGTCEPGENNDNCPQDCYCGNGTCDPGETAGSCPGDCGSTAGWQPDPNGVTIVDGNVGIRMPSSSTSSLSVAGKTEFDGDLFIQSYVSSLRVDENGISFNNGTNSITVDMGGLHLFSPYGGADLDGNLKVDGTVYGREVIVTLDDFPDYVFADDFKPKSLEELENYINENKHLPGIPPASEVKENGLNVGEMQAKLLEKVEEMTLYMIELKKENKELKERVEEIENR